MVAVQIREPGVVDVVPFGEPPQPASDSMALVRVRVIGLCGTDLKTFRGDNPMVTYPRIIGHEVCGEVVRLTGPAGVKEGERVTVFPYANCGRCDACRKGRANCCRNNQTLGVQRDGAASGMVWLPADTLIGVDSLGDESAALVEPVSVAHHAVRRAAPAAGETVVVLGCGMIGLGAVLAASVAGARVIAVDVDARKTEAARSLGAADTVDVSRVDLSDALDELCGGEGSDTVIEAVGSAATFRQAVEVVGYAGRVVYIGYAAERVDYDPKHFVAKELDVLGSRNATREDFAAVLRILEPGTVDLSAFVTHRMEAPAAPEALRLWSQKPAEVTKILLSFQ